MVVPTSPPREGYVNSSEDFEKWIRMATDNKINTTNSWDLALIDYFYDLSLLRDGDGINFQKASATLDGCVKIYSSRVDSAATETGRLISGLSTRREKTTTETGSDEEDEDEDLDEMHPDAPQRRKKGRSNTKKDTVVEWKALQVKKMDMELYVDPLFKKALADFDEGGAKSLLLNMLNVDQVGRIVFDTTESAEAQRDHTGDGTHDGGVDQDESGMDIDLPEDMEGKSAHDPTLNGHIMGLGERFLATCMNSDMNVCPSIRELREVVEQKSTSADLLKGLEQMEIPKGYDYNLTAGNYETTYQNFDISLGVGAAPDHYDDDFGAVDQGPEPGPEQNNSKYPGNRTSIFFNDLDDEADDYGVTMRMLFDENKSYGNDGHDSVDPGSVTNLPDEDLLAYFDQNQRINWAGPDHWKVTRLKKISNLKSVSSHGIHDQGEEKTNTLKKKPKERVLVDFLADDNFPDQDVIFETGAHTINLPKQQWFSMDRHMLPDDRHFTTRNFITLFTKNKLINSRFNKVKNMESAIDESLYAAMAPEPEAPPINQADFYNDDYGGGADFDDFAPADDYEAPLATQPLSSQLLSKSHGSQLPLNYSRVSKKVDIKLLKDNLWETLKQERTTRKSMAPPSAPEPQTPPPETDTETLKFSEVVEGLGTKYDQKTKKDLSTSFCFICLLHLANENGFTIANNDDNSDLIIKNFANI